MTGAADRTVGRLIAGVAVVLLGAVAAWRLPVDLAPESSSPEVVVALDLPRPSSAEAVTRDWVLPLESAVRSLGALRGMVGTVSAGGADLRVRFEPRTDARAKAARLLSEFAPLRARLPERARLSVTPTTGGGGRNVAVLMLLGPLSGAEASRVANRLRNLRGVRSVATFGEAAEEVAVHLASADRATERAATVHAAIVRSMSLATVGEIDRSEQRLRVLSEAGRVDDLARVPVRVGGTTAPLAQVAAVVTRPAEPRQRFRVDGGLAIAYRVWKDQDASLLAVDRELRREAARLFEEHGAELELVVLWSEADGVRTLARRLVLGALLAVALGIVGGAMAGGWRLALALGMSVPLGAAAAQNALWIAGATLNMVTLPVLGLAVAAALLVACAPRATAAVTVSVLALLVPFAVELAARDLGPVLREPARVFATCCAPAALVARLLPVPASARRAAWLGAVSRRLLRDPATVLLGAAAFVVLATSLFGLSLDPRRGSQASDPVTIRVETSLPEGSTLDQAEESARAVEAALDHLEVRGRAWSFISTQGTSTTVELPSGTGNPAATRRLRLLLRQVLAARGLVARVDSPLLAGGGLTLGGDMEARADMDPECTFARYVLRSPRLFELQVALDRVEQRLVRAGVGHASVDRGWGSPSVRVELRPRLLTPPAQARALAGALAAASEPAPALSLPGVVPRALVVTAPGLPERDDDVPQRWQLLESPVGAGGSRVVPASLVRVVETSVVPEVPRQAGRFVVAVTAGFTARSDDQRWEGRRRADESLSTLPLPAGVDLERPSLRRSPWTAERWRLLGLAALLPCLLWVAATVRLDSMLVGGACVLPAGLGIVACAPLLWAWGQAVDEMGLLALAAATVASTALGCEAAGDVLRRWRAGASAALAVMREVRRGLPRGLSAAAVAVALLFGASVGAGVGTLDWSTGLKVAGVAMGVGAVASFVVLPAGLLVGLTWVRRDAALERRRRRPPEWERDASVKSLAVRSVTKDYRGGHRALRDVSFELGPGVVGLLGRNGAGKTTLLRLMSGLLLPTRGQVLVRGVPLGPVNIESFRGLVGYLPQEFNAYPGFTGLEFLEYWAIERGMDDRVARRREIEELLDVVGLSEHGRRKVRDYSGGMRQRVGIARALLGAPPILIVDEPTTGLDVDARARFREVLLRVASRRVVVFSTHLAADVEAVATRLLLLHRGRLIFDGAPQTLVSRARGRVFEALVADHDLREVSRRYRLVARVRTLAGIRVRGVAPPGVPLPGPAVEPRLEEAYLAEVEAAELAAAVGLAPS